MVIKLRCKHCYSKISAEDDLIGKEVFCPACNAVIPLPTPQFGCGSKINGFEIEQWLGSGAMGEVYLARQVSMNRQVALKVLPISDTLGEDDKKRFLKEAQILAKLNHPNIVPAYDAGTTENCHYMTMGFINGKTLEDMQRKSGVLPELEMLEAMEKLTNALRYAWEQSKLLHRDIKPANIMIDEFNTVKLMDMGIAKNMNEDASLTQAGFIVGTPYFMSPEQAQSSPNLDFRSDLYALGCTMYQMLSGKLPYTGPNIMAILSNKLSNNFISLEKVTSHVSLPTCQLIDSLINFNPDLRPSSFDEIDQLIQNCKETANTHLPTVEITNFNFEAPTQIQVQPKPANNREFLLISALLILIIIVLSSFLFIDDNQKTSSMEQPTQVTTPNKTKFDSAQLPKFSIENIDIHNEVLGLFKEDPMCLPNSNNPHIEKRGNVTIANNKIILEGGKLSVRHIGKNLIQNINRNNTLFIYLEFTSSNIKTTGTIFSMESAKKSNGISLKQKNSTLSLKSFDKTIELGTLSSTTNALAILYKNQHLNITVNGKSIHQSKATLPLIRDKMPIFLGGIKNSSETWTGSIFRAYIPTKVPEKALKYFFPKL